jgi:hypothetical protein
MTRANVILARCHIRAITRRAEARAWAKDDGAALILGGLLLLTVP